MILYENPNQPCLPGFEKFFGIPLDENNRWVKLSKIIPWDEFAKAYNQNMSPRRGRPAKAARLVVGAVIIKHKLCLSDEETIDQIRENPYLQYFIGLSTFQTKAPFAPSLFVDIRRRMGAEVFEQFNQSIINKLESNPKVKKKEPSQEKPESSPQVDDKPEKEEQSPDRANETQQEQHQGKLILDATVVEQAIRFPTDLGLLNEARGISEKLIDTLYPQSGLVKKPRTYRRKARKAYLALVKQRNPKTNKRRGGIRQQLQYLKRNLSHIEKLLDLVADESTALNFPQRRQYWIVQHFFSASKSGGFMLIFCFQKAVLCHQSTGECCGFAS